MTPKNCTNRPPPAYPSNPHPAAAAALAEADRFAEARSDDSPSSGRSNCFTARSNAAAEHATPPPQQRIRHLLPPSTPEQEATPPQAPSPTKQSGPTPCTRPAKPTSRAASSRTPSSSHATASEHPNSQTNYAYSPPFTEETIKNRPKTSTQKPSHSPDNRATTRNSAPSTRKNEKNRTQIRDC